MKLICPDCNEINEFIVNENEHYKCEKCNHTFKQCKSKECENLTRIGIFCKRCINIGIKKGGGAATAAVVLGAAKLAFNFLKK